MTCDAPVEGRLDYDRGSYRDRDGRVFYDDDGNVFRALSEHALREWNSVSRKPFLQAAMQGGRIVGTEQVSATDDDHLGDGWAGVLRHQLIPFVSYPYEWTFGMLQDAAVLQLELLLAALEEDVILKDGTAYNVQWLGARPVFIDVASFERLSPGQAWAGYRQFCQTCLFPLLLQAYKQISFQPWLRGRLDGISPRECRNAMSLRDLFRRGVATHIFLHAWLDARSESAQRDAGRSLPVAGFDKKLIQSNVAGLLRLVRGLRWSPPATVWSGYASSNSYEPADKQSKEAFVRRVAQSRRWKLVWDVGSNTGTYSRIVAENADTVIALDADHGAVEQLYQSLKAQDEAKRGRILPLVASLVDPPCGMGWRGAERKSLEQRGRPELVLCLALMHHLVIGAGVPLRELLDWLAGLGCSFVIEFVSKADPMVQQLLRGRRDNYSDYELDVFERLLVERFDVVRSELLASGTRKLYYATPRSAP